MISVHWSYIADPASKRFDHIRPSSRSNSLDRTELVFRTESMLSHPTVVGSWRHMLACCIGLPRVQLWHSLRFGQHQKGGSDRNHPLG